jgi:hypothetical protein
MACLGVDMRVVLPSPGFYHYDPDAAVTAAMSEDRNNEIHDMTTSWPARFAGLATLPMQDVKAAIACPVPRIASLERFTQDEKEAILRKNLERLRGL